MDVLVVLGSRDCQYRVEKALEVGGRNPKTVYVVSGGNPHLDELESEAEFMRDCLWAHGVPQARIVIEDRSRNTMENLVFSMERVDRLSVAGILPSDSIRIGIVSGGFHLPRVQELVSENLGERAKSIKVIPAYGPHSGRDDWFRHPSFVQSALAEIRKRKGDVRIL